MMKNPKIRRALPWETMTVVTMTVRRMIPVIPALMKTPRTNAPICNPCN